jgi:hypothetical protein
MRPQPRSGALSRWRRWLTTVPHSHMSRARTSAPGSPGTNTEDAERRGANADLLTFLHRGIACRSLRPQPPPALAPAPRSPCWRG